MGMVLELEFSRRPRRDYNYANALLRRRRERATDVWNGISAKEERRVLPLCRGIEYKVGFCGNEEWAPPRRGSFVFLLAPFFLPSFLPSWGSWFRSRFFPLFPRQDRWHRLLPDTCVSFYETFQLPLVKSLSLIVRNPISLLSKNSKQKYLCFVQFICRGVVIKSRWISIISNNPPIYRNRYRSSQKNF